MVQIIEKVTDKCLPEKSTSKVNQTSRLQNFKVEKEETYEYCVQLCLNEKIQIRHMAIESTRLAANKTLEKTTGESGYYSRLRVYPHNLLRENKQIATAGADRISEGMRRSWGKPQSV